MAKWSPGKHPRDSKGRFKKKKGGSSRPGAAANSGVYGIKQSPGNVNLGTRSASRNPLKKKRVKLPSGRRLATPEEMRERTKRWKKKK